MLHHSTLGLARIKGKDRSKNRRLSGAIPNGRHSCAEESVLPPLPSSGSDPPTVASGACGETRDIPSSEPLGAGARVYACLYENVEGVIQVNRNSLW